MLGKIFAVIMFPLSILILLEHFEVFTLNFPIDKLLVASSIMIIFQLINIITAKAKNRKLTEISILFIRKYAKVTNPFP